ncbi:MAG: S4 domain-containing protein, partial [Pseudomonadota bacterium]|nr:S4 domain-containing protein [Pseudomonadota bacterium]
MNKTIKFFVEKKFSGERVDIFLSKKIKNYTRSYIKKLIDKNNLEINDKLVKSSSTKIRENDQISFNLVEKEINKLEPNKIKIDTVYEDEDFLIVNKPKGMVVHPGAGNFKNTLANALAYKYKNNLSNLGGLLRPGIVHRIDK